MFELHSDSKESTKALGEKLASFLRPGDVVLLEGELGAGKTTLVSGVAEGLRCGEDVISPTFNILKCYFKGTLPLYHIDAYRLEGQNMELGLEEFIEGDGACFIEWPVYIESLLPDERLHIRLYHDGSARRIVIEGKGPRGQELEEALRN
ncbi:MAG: tRNA (adenosine(37)-N6)-threonylcarbamoyltransferase complex ATPase subunit type 1 TsaE [Bacilli bacterium]|nr:tRNA (adenosine(37)-N6)-threonylcarbamoyltransferase complex ATPase subunit type 1 TsaE [Bacilli bacterium]